MKLHDLQKTPGSTHRRKRLGAGVGTGNGKTCGRGHKGQRSRAGSSQRPLFESGHIPIYRRLPHRGFTRGRFIKEMATVNVGQLAKLEGDTADRGSLIEAGLLRGSDKRFKVLGDGEIGKALTVTADKFSASARQKIEAAGGKAIENAPAPAPEPEAADAGEASAEDNA